MSIDIDPVATAGLVTREVRSGERDGEPTRIAVARRSYAASRGDVWAAVTDPERISRWFMPVTGDLVEGGSYQLEGNAGGTVLHCQAPEAFAVTWEFGGGTSWVSIALRPHDGGTTLELVHESPVLPEFAEQYGPGAVGVGWDLAIMGLGMHLGSGEPTDPAAAEAWTLSPDGVAFVRAAAHGWAAAATADGDDHEAATAAAERTVAFYTTAPEA
ncbi:SRPBCC family protein [Isoptericola jiangsuensis]|uniref:SRPBCC family protein n=1 Tax=Isoptericola jiangsuensis TaxID=548579 RepID=UPI003AADF051